VSYYINCNEFLRFSNIYIYMFIYLFDFARLHQQDKKKERKKERKYTIKRGGIEAYFDGTVCSPRVRNVYSTDNFSFLRSRYGMNSGANSDPLVTPRSHFHLSSQSTSMDTNVHSLQDDFFFSFRITPWPKKKEKEREFSKVMVWDNVRTAAKYSVHLRSKKIKTHDRKRIHPLVNEA